MGLLSKAADAIENVTETMADRMLNFPNMLSEVGAGVDKMISQGAAEMGQAIFTGNAYMPYGPTNEQLPVMEQAAETALAQAAEAPAQEAPAAEPPQSYDQMLDSYAPASPPVQQQENEMQR